MIRSVRIHEFGGPGVLRIEEIEVEEPGEGEVHMRIRGIGINRTEITLRSGRSPAKPALPTKTARPAHYATSISSLSPRATTSSFTDAFQEPAVQYLGSPRISSGSRMAVLPNTGTSCRTRRQRPNRRAACRCLATASRPEHVCRMKLHNCCLSLTG